MIERALDGFGRDDAATSNAEWERQRVEMLERFPRESWATMDLERYAIGHDHDLENAYCRWVEFNTPELGSIRGGSARKLIIYKHRNKPGWYYDSKSFSSVEEAWQAVRQAFVDAFALAEGGRWQEIDAIKPLRPGPALLLKTLHVYFPDDVLPVCSQGHLRHFLNSLGHPAGNNHSLGALALNQTLLRELKSIPELRDWTTKELERLLYRRFPRPWQRVLVVTPGSDGSFWDECLAGGFICVNWDEFGDLREFASQEEFADAFAESYAQRYGGRDAAAKKAAELWLLREAQPGDLIVANRGTTEVLAVGTVVEPAYFWERDRPACRHTVRVDWDTGYAKTIEPVKGWNVTTVSRLPEKLLPVIMRKDGIVKNGPPLPANPLYEEIAEVLESKGQAILYGPPGTGKTYHARRFAVWWLARRRGDSDSADVLADASRFEQLENEFGRATSARKVWWAVANPAQWTWDRLFADGSVDFTRGRLQRNFLVAQPGDLVIGYESTPTKRITALARVARPFGADADGEPRLQLEPVSPISDGPTWNEISSDPELAQAEPVRFRAQGTLFALAAQEADHLLAILAERNPELVGRLDLGGEAGVAALTRVTFHPSYAYEDFVEALRPVQAAGGGGFTLEIDSGVFKRVCLEARVNRERTYLVLIDEFNRANVARVFGELVTLLERDKRGLEVVLPQSKEIFTVPPNVFVLGTMNTADRSIRLLDAALRRRFGFVELMPDATLLSGEQIGNLKLAAFVDELNQRIARLYGREKQIGHSFFLADGKPVADADSFARVFRHEIMPLLQEYSYEDYRQLAKVVGPGIVDEERLELKHDVLADADRLLSALEAEF